MVESIDQGMGVLTESGEGASSVDSPFLGR